MEQYAISALVTVFSSLFTMYLAYNTGMTRMKHKELPYKAIKSKEVMIANRAHMNCVENSVVFLPLLWIATIFGSSSIIGIIGALWFASRVWYALGYLKDPKKRQIPFMIGLACIAITGILALYGIIV